VALSWLIDQLNVVAIAGAIGVLHRRSGFDLVRIVENSRWFGAAACLLR
jgi:hypothetical protein